MKNMLALFGVLLAADCGAAVYAGKKYDMRGPISGYRTGDNGICYVAMTTSDGYYTDGYHEVSDRQMCKLARATYLLRGDIRARAEVRYGTDTNAFTEFEVNRDSEPYWPPYRAANNAATYKLSGSINGYLLVRGNTSCFVSVKGTTNVALGSGYHEVKKSSHCAVLLGAYLDGSTVNLSAEKTGDINQIVSAELSDSPKAYWPPYGKH